MTPKAGASAGAGAEARPPPHAPRAAAGHQTGARTSRNSIGGGGRASLELGNIQMMQRPRRASEDEIRALLERTTRALDKIVKIRESMEDFVDFSDYKTTKTVRIKSAKLGSARASSRTSASSLGTVKEHEQVDHTRTSPASSYGSTDASSISDERSSMMIVDGCSTASTHSSTGSLPEYGHKQTDGRLLDHSEEYDEDCESTISSSSVSAFKEARLERLKNIEISFHEGMPKEFFQAMARFLHASLEVKTRHSRFSFFKDAFVGSDAVRNLIGDGYAEDHPTALRYGNVLVKLGLIEHVSRTDDQLHNSKDNFYRFTKALDHGNGEFYGTDMNTRMSINANNYRESVVARESIASQTFDFEEASDQVHALVTDETLAVIAKVLHKVFERKNKLLFYKGYVGCFLGAEAVNVMRELRLATSLIDAIFIGQCLLDEGIIEPIATTVSSFQDKYIFYRLTKIRS
ncbi:TPA: hypothetical protein N0F65_002007 [Lagenidium giganteum]|uniref:DEP domain-containing protein n=1 Tax=Lagenidium giganteum TaxID=4803 RepID=A0AAV2Z351_9STRA|nr:TPA: hypothetical protein N0F65_002007 [Lagenidium giganteum]